MNPTSGNPPTKLPLVAAWHMEDWFFCQRKISLWRDQGEKQSGSKTHGKTVHAEIEHAIREMPGKKITLPLPEIDIDGPVVITPEPSLRAPQLGLMGRPDLLFIGEGMVRVVELKSVGGPRERSRKWNAMVFESHAAQVVAYGLMVEEMMGIRPDLAMVYRAGDIQDAILQGVDPLSALRSQDLVQIPFTEKNRNFVLSTLEDLRATLLGGDASRSHNLRARCQGCVYRYSCDERL